MGKIKKASDLVRELLTKDREMGANSEKIQLNSWFLQDPDIMTKSFAEFANEYIKTNSKYVPATSIDRARRRLQSKHKELRDSQWEKRKGNQKKAIDDINSIE